MADISVGDITARLRIDSSQFDSALRSAQERLKQLTDEVGRQRQVIEQTGTAWSRMLQIAGGLGIATGIGAITAAAVRLGQAFVSTGMQFEQLRTQLNALSGSAQAGAAQFAFLTDTAQRLGYSLPALTQGFIQISGATRGTALAGLETQKVFDAVATSARAMGASQQQTERALLAIGQVISKGTVQMEELRGQLAEAIPGAVQIAARAFGVTTERLNEMVRAGEMGAIPFVRALARQMQFELAPAAAQAGQTTAAAFQRLATEIQLAAAALANSGILQMLASISNAATKVLADIRKALESRQQVQSIFEQEALMGTGLRTEQVAEPMRRRLAEMQREIDGLRASLQQWNRAVAEKPSLADDPELARQRTQLANLEAQRLAILQAARTIQGAKDVEQQRVAEVNKVDAARAAEETRLESIRKKLEEIGRLEAGLAKESAAMPGFAGRLGGTPEQAETFYRAQQAGLRKTLGELGEIVRGMTGPLPPELAARITEVSNRYERLGLSLNSVREAQSQAKTVATDYQRDLERASSVLATIDALLERYRAFVRRPEEETAERAATAVRTQGAQMRAQLEAQLLAFQQSQILTVREPGTGEQLRQAIAGIAEETERLATAARDAKLEDTMMTPLRKLVATYTDVKVVRDADTAATYAAALAGTRFADEAQRYLTIIQDTAKIEAQIPTLRAQAESSANAFAESQRKVAQETATLAKMQEQLDVQRAGLRALPWEQRTARTAARTADVTFTDPERRREYEALLKQQAQVERLVWVNKQLETAADGVATAWITAFDKIITGTASVGTAFRAMAQDILASLRSVAQSAMSDLWRQLFGLGVSAIAGLFTPTATYTMAPAGAGPSNVAPFTPFTGMQGGGIVHRPTLTMLGEAGPEAVVNRQQMDELMGFARASGPSAGGQAMGDITIVNYTNKEQAEARAAQERAAGKQVIVNEILSDISRGESSSIVRALRTVQR